jgi:hypothetical protein
MDLIGQTSAGAQETLLSREINPIQHSTRPQPHPPTALRTARCTPQEEAAAWSEEVVDMMLEQEDEAKAAAAGPSTLGIMAEEAAAAAAAGDDDDDDDDEEKPFMELAVAGSGVTGQGACVRAYTWNGTWVYVCGGEGTDGSPKHRHASPRVPCSPSHQHTHDVLLYGMNQTSRRAGPAAGAGRGAAGHHGARRGGPPLLRGLHAQPGGCVVAAGTDRQTDKQASKQASKLDRWGGCWERHPTDPAGLDRLDGWPV